MDLSGKHAVVTGAANGIGRALARRFHSAGANVVIADVDATGCADVAAALNAQRPASAMGLAADVGSEQGNVDLIRAAEGTFGTIDLFFANAGIGGGTDLDSTTEEMWQHTFDVNVNAHRWAAKHLVPTWLERGEGYFCSTASAAGILSQIGSAPYSVSKHAAVAFAEWLSITFGSRGVRVSCLCPQGVNTNMLNGGELGSGPSTDVVRSAGVVLEPEDVADTVLDAIGRETFLITPHPEVLTYWQRKVTDYDRWIGGMRRLQDRIVGNG